MMAEHDALGFATRPRREDNRGRSIAAELPLLHDPPVRCQASGEPGAALLGTIESREHVLHIDRAGRCRDSVQSLQENATGHDGLNPALGDGRGERGG